MSLPQTTSDDDFRLRPPECRSREELERELADPICFPEAPPPAAPFQFSIGDVMLLMVGVSVGVAGGSWMPARIFGFYLGLLTILVLIGFTLHPPQSRTARLVLTTVLVAYFSAMLAAAIRPPAELP
jgi:hypothetical protein